jgi:hypothetical protein
LEIEETLLLVGGVFQMFLCPVGAISKIRMQQKIARNDLFTNGKHISKCEKGSLDTACDWRWSQKTVDRDTDCKAVVEFH